MRTLIVDWKRTSLALFLLVLALGSYSIYSLVRAGSSGNALYVEGGGFCPGTYTLYNQTTKNLLFAENCQTGQNQFNSSDFGALFNSVRAAMTSGGVISMRQGIYAATTSAVFSTTAQSFFACGLSLIGATGIGSTIGGANPVNGTVIVAKTGGMTVIKSTTTPSTSAPSLIGCIIKGITIQLTGVLNAVGIDFRMTETRTDNKFIDIGVDCQSATNCAAGIGLYLDGNEDTQVIDYNGGGLYGTSTSEDIIWKSSLGNVIIEDSAFTIALVSAQTVSIIDSTISQLNVDGATNSLAFINDYIANAPAVGLGGRINVNAQTVHTLSMQNCWISITSAIPLFVSTGTISNSAFISNSWNFGASSNWNANAATLTKQNSNGGNNAVSGSAPTNFPFTLDGNSNF